MPKLGRNDPCWCGSGRKYKKCHLGRSEAKALPISDALDASKKARAKGGCQSPVGMHDQCLGEPINSHSISKSLGLGRIAETGHILGLKHDFATLSRTKGRAELGPIGVNKMSIFPGFCALHDKSLFAPVEDAPFSYTQEQCALLSYRAIARERHAKAFGTDINEFLKGADRGKSLPFQMAIQGFLASSEVGLSLATADLDRAIEHHHRSIVDRNFDVFESAVFEFSEDFPLLCSTGHMPSDDWAGRVVQDLADPSLNADWLTAVAFHAEGSAWVVFTWLKSASLVRDFVDTLQRHFEGREADALVKYFFSISENIAVNPAWWAGLSDEIKKALNARIMDGVPIGGGVNVMAPRPGEPIALELPLRSHRRV